MASHFAGGDTVIDAQLPVNALHLCANGRDGNDQGLRNLRVGIASGKQAQHLLFLPAELCREQRRIWRDGKALFHACGGRHMQDGLAIGAQRCLAQGESLQEGDQGIAFHREIGEYARAAGIDRLLTTGELATHAVASFGPGGEHFADVDALIAATGAKLRGEDAARVTLLVKGSRFMRMERVVAALTGATVGGSH